jgi:hypothetical protein
LVIQNFHQYLHQVIAIFGKTDKKWSWWLIEMAFIEAKTWLDFGPLTRTFRLRLSLAHCEHKLNPLEDSGQLSQRAKSAYGCRDNSGSSG